MTQRRDILTASGGLLAAFMASGANAQEQSIEADLTDAEKANIRLVDTFCKAWEAMDLAEVFATMKEDAVYRQSQDTPPVTGHQAISDLMKLWVDDSYRIDYIVEETFARGPVVINRRIDIYHRNNAEDHLEWEGVGLFLIEGGLIREWQDFTMRIQRGRA
jgi:limonene-1,2-epoxide hydrolase